MLHSIYDLTTFCRKTTGDVPAKLVGASTIVVGSKMYLFGGRLVTERKMVSDLYEFDLETFNWEKISISAEDDVPRARYFHSADTWDNQLIIFGGMSNQPDSVNPDELCVLNDVRFFDLATRHWLPDVQSSVPASDSLIPRARYAHLSSVTADRLFVIGGQDFNNTWLDDVCVYDLVGKAWVQRRDYPRHCGTYRSVAVCSTTAVRFPQEEIRNSQSASTLGPPGQRFGPDMDSPSSPEYTPSESLTHQPYSAPPTDDHPSDIYLYSNYNFTDVKRELEVFSPLPDTDFTIQDRSSAMNGANFPPGLRFPTGAILGTHLIIAGTYLAHSYQSFSIWVLDLQTMAWSRIEPGKAVESGSWFRGCLWPEGNRFLIFGNRNGNLVDDYNRRLLSWDHVAVVDLEAFGIYQPPSLKLDITMQELGLAALEERVVTDFEIICDDGRKLTCSRVVLEERWPWFKEQRARFMQTAKNTLENLPPSSTHVGLPELPGTLLDKAPRLDPRLTPRSFLLSEPYPITLALLQYFYTTALITPLQHAPPVLSQLLVLATNYEITHLESLVKHAMHRALSNSTSVGVYEVATLCSCRSLQIRALKTVMSYTQKRPSRSRGDKDNAGTGKPPGGGPGGGPANDGGPPNGGGGSNSGSESQNVARPRGTSDARFRNMTSAGTSNASYSKPRTGMISSQRANERRIA
ncbi:galactose oxidase [Tricholoma matsutake]|nr:galactose oxidase [Tricholoma matsutake 945]